MSQPARSPGEFRVADLSTRHATPFLLTPDAAARSALASELGISGVRKLRFEGSIAPEGRGGWKLTARLGATVTQPCVVTLAPVTTRIDEDVERRFVPPEMLETPESGAETEMPEDVTTDPLGSTISAFDVMVESLALALPLYPRAEGAELGQATFAEDGVTPLQDEELKPFAALQGLKEKLDKKS